MDAGGRLVRSVLPDPGDHALHQGDVRGGERPAAERLARERDELAATEPEGGFYVDGDARGLILGWRHGF